jgi:hypothetical protein
MGAMDKMTRLNNRETFEVKLHHFVNTFLADGDQING